MSNLGEELRGEREAKGLSLDDVHESLNVPVHYLHAMEGGDSPLVADSFYVVPFLRRYASFLQKDPDVCVARYLADEVRKEKQPSPRAEPPPAVPASWVVTAVVAAVGGAAVAWLVLL